jgi:hypothetical protein
MMSEADIVVRRLPRRQLDRVTPLLLIRPRLKLGVPSKIRPRVAVARTERRAVVTNNVRDYRPLHSDAITPGGPGHFGMIFMPGNYRRTKADTGRIISALEGKLAEYPGDEDLENGECWL